MTLLHLANAQFEHGSNSETDAEQANACTNPPRRTAQPEHSSHSSTDARRFWPKHNSESFNHHTKCTGCDKVCQLLSFGAMRSGG